MNATWREWLNRYSGWIIITILSLIPIIRFLQLNPLSLQFKTTFSTFHFLGRSAAIIGICLFALNFVLSTRLKFLEKIFYGLNQVYIAHHIVGGIAFILLLLHPSLLAFRYLPEIGKAAAFMVPPLTPPYDWPLMFGILALDSLLVILVITFFVKLRYELWLLIHKLIGISLFLAIIHALFINSDATFDPFLKWYLVAITGFGLAAYVHTTLLNMFFVRKYKYVIKHVENLNQDVTQITLEPIKHIIPYSAGQFIFVTFLQDGIPPQRHPFSITSAPDNSGKQELSITVKHVGDFTALLSQLTVGTKASIEGAFGKFAYTHAKNKKQIWIAGGIGVTPFISMAKFLESNEYRIDIFHVVHEEGDLIANEVFREKSQESTINVKYHPHVRQQEGVRITATYIKNTVGDLHNTDIFICGPQAMMSSLRNQFITLGVPRSLIHTEEFTLG